MQSGKNNVKLRGKYRELHLHYVSQSPDGQ